MKPITKTSPFTVASFSFRFIPAALGLMCALLANDARAATSLYFDVNGTAAGSGVVNGGTYSWDGTSWDLSSALTGAATVWAAGDFARFTTAVAGYTVTVNASESMAGLFNTQSGATVTINDAGSGTGNLNITTTGGTTTPNDPAMNVQGFLCGGIVIVNCPITGAGGIQHSQTKDLYLNGTNSYAGGTWTTGGQLIYYNNNYAFGSGHFYVGGSADAIINNSSQALTITNKFVFPTAGYTFNLAGGNPVAGAPGTTFSGPFALPSGTTVLLTSSGASQVDKISGVISGTGAALTISDNGTMILAATNTYTGLTIVGNAGGTFNPTLEISGAIAGDLRVTNTAKLTLDHAATLMTSAKFSFASSLAAGAINLNFTGTNTVLAVYLDGILQPAGSWGAPGSGADNQNGIFTGSGLLYVPAAPVIVQQPSSLGAYPQQPSRTFTVSVTGDQPSMTYQWKLNNINLSDNGISIFGSQSSQLTLSPPYTAGTYTCAITNSAGFANTLPATLTILATNDYVNAVLAANPIAYWRLDETSGTSANDWVGLHAGTYINARLNQPGFSSASGSDPAMGIPANTSQKGYMVISNASPDFSFPTVPFTFEAWGFSTNFGAGVKQRLISTLTLTGAGGYGFGLPDSQHLQLTAGGVGEFDAPLSTPLAAGVWYHFVATCDGNNYTLYVNGNPVGTHTISGLAFPASPGQFTVGNNPLAYPSEQFYGAIDEVAIYNYALDQTTVTNHYLARYTDLTAPTVTTPVVTPPTNYVSLSSTLTEAAGGAGLTYQWYKGAGNASPVASGTDSTLTLGPLQLSDAASYHCVVTDAGSHTADSPLAYLAVLPIPTNASDLNLTNGLVLHLPFDGDYKDISGRSNDGAAVGSPAFAVSGEIGGGALHYGATNGVSTNYVTVGVRPDLQFGASTDFTVSYWVRGAFNTNLPFFSDATGGEAGIIALNGGFYFGPNTTGNGGWAVGVGSAAHEMTSSGAGVINEGNWHHLVHVAKRTGNVTTYLDGANVDSHAVSFVSDSINTANPANIGQDGTGTQVFTQDQNGDIDDLAVWTRTLTSLEVSGIYLAGASNNVSFAPPVAAPIVPVALQLQQVAGQWQIVWTGTGGALQAAGTVTGPYTNVPSASSPYPIPVSSGPQLFYRLQY
jgi:autotransporter-associated beta strand protein